MDNFQEIAQVLKLEPFDSAEYLVQGVSDGCYVDSSFVRREGKLLELSGFELREATNDVDELVNWNTATGAIPADITAVDFRSLLMTAWLFHKLEKKLMPSPCRNTLRSARR